MTIHLNPARLLAGTLFFALLPFSIQLWADNHASPPQTFVLESFGCSFNDGKDADDLYAVRDAYVKAADKAGIKKPRSIVWNRFKGGPNVDFLWMNVHPNLAAFAAHTEDMAKSEMSGVVDKFNAMASCGSAFSGARVIFAGGQPPVTEPPGVVESYGCFFTHGRGQSDLADLGAHIADYNRNAPNTESLVIIGTNPMTPGPNTPDRFIFGVHEDMSTWAARTAEVRSSPAGQRMLRHFGTVFGKCYSALWSSQMMVEADTE